MSGTHDTRCCCERLLLCTGDGKALGYICALGESVRFGGKNSRRGAAGQILGDSGRRIQTGEAQIRTQAERNDREKPQEGLNIEARAVHYFLQMS